MKSSARVSMVGLILVLLSSGLYAQAAPKREFRGAWIATVSNLDWPSSSLRGADPASQRSQLASILSSLKSCGLNAVVFQVRPECDAFYPSSIDPWSYYLTGVQGSLAVATDPLQAAIDEAHSRGLELHAWFNPYRALVNGDPNSSSYHPPAANHVTNSHPEWILSFGVLRMLDPGIPAVREYVVSVIMDVVRRYDVDGVHFDDYFYPYSGITTQDDASWVTYRRGFTDRAAWRRDNVNLLIKMVHDSIQSVKPNIKFGISPFGIWKSGNPPTALGTLSAYDQIYCDALAWVNSSTVDYLTPQVYWAIGSQTSSSYPRNTDYALIVPWWAGQVKDRHLYVGQAAYRIKDGNWAATELPNQIRLNRMISYVQGSVFFRATYGVTDNPKGFADSLKGQIYEYPALRPLMSWKETVPPNAPGGLMISKFSSFATLSWTAPAPASDGGVADQYVIYRSTSLPIQTDDARNILAIQSGTSYLEQPLPAAGVTYYYGISAVDRLQNESGMSNVMGLTSAGVVNVDQSDILPKEFALYQNYPNPFNPSTAISYHLSAVSVITLKVYDILGREVATLVDGVRNAGSYTVQWNASSMPSGMYVYRLRAVDGANREVVLAKKMLLLK